MATTTARLGLTKPAGSENIAVSVLNANADKIDSLIGYAPVTSSTRPTSPYNGQTIRETDTGKLYVHNGSTPASAGWVQVPTTDATLDLSASVLIRWGGDASISRSGANALRTSGGFQVTGTLAASAALTVGGNETVSGSGATSGNQSIGGNLDVAGSIRQAGSAVQLAKRLYSTQVSITPSAANAPTSVTISYPAMDGSVFRAFVTPQSTVPGTTVTGVGATSVTASSATIWCTRTNTTATIVSVLVVGSDS